MIDNVVAHKKNLRAKIRKARKMLTDDQRKIAADLIARQAMRFLRRGKRIGAYWSSGSELDLFELINRAVNCKAEVYFPVIPSRGRRLWFSRFDENSNWYHERRFGILECTGRARRAEQLDVIFMPLLGIDADGYRLGQGGGFYDTTLSFQQRRKVARKPLLIGVAYSCQILTEPVPREVWDMPIDGLITEKGFVKFGSVFA